MPDDAPQPAPPGVCSSATNCLTHTVDPDGTVWLSSNRRPDVRLRVDPDEWASRPAELGGPGELADARYEFDPRLVDVLQEVAAERGRQDAKWGEQNHPNGTGPDFGHYWTDAAQARGLCDSAHRAGRGTWAHILAEEHAEALGEDDPARLRAELVQVAAVVVAWVAAIDRRAGRG